MEEQDKTGVRQGGGGAARLGTGGRYVDAKALRAWASSALDGDGAVLIDGYAGVVCSRGIGMAWLLLRREPGFMPRLLGGGEVVG